ncbi:probable pectinesterase/pectinesterase inhibitor 40 isoform X2 [Arachis hypogaea]|uniref:probable pectinesterase/pectinesterase inhibitor 40 isoform X2 n=1 Tax=Arachis hypogaea TaxID=3818 RepID=UPI003B21A896
MQRTLYPDLCVSTLSTFPNLETKAMPQIISKVVNHTVHEVKSSSNNCTTTIKNLQNTLNTNEKRALDDCLKLFDDTIVELNTTILDLSKNPSSSSSSNQDLETLLSGAMTNLYTCLDGFSQSKNGNAVRGLIEEKVIEISHHVSNSLAMLKKVKTSLKKEQVFAEYGKMKKGFPSWVSAKDRKLLEGGNVNETKIDVVVAKDGSGNFTTIGEAVAMAPNSSTTRFVIYIKSGAYFENVEVIRKKTSLMFIGDGIGRTIIKASRNVVDGWTTFQSATVDKRQEKMEFSTSECRELPVRFKHIKRPNLKIGLHRLSTSLEKVGFNTDSTPKKLGSKDSWQIKGRLSILKGTTLRSLTNTSRTAAFGH